MVTSEPVAAKPKGDAPPGATSEKDQADAEEAASAAVSSFPIVGIGASAGGLAAFEAFFSALPADDDESGTAFVLVQHLAPDHKSILAELVRRYCRLPVIEIEDGMSVRPSTVYIIPPNRDLAFADGVLNLLEPAVPHGQRRTIDVFFRSLALGQRERAIGIVLSGTGSDGMLGARAIKGEGGMLMAQNPESTDYDGMPRSVIGTGLVDYVLPPAEMPAQLLAYVTRTVHPLAPAPNSESRAELQQVFAALQEQTGHDFALYKQNTIGRRIERRMAVHQIEKLSDYVRRLKESPPEVEALFRELLIGVTSFFRDPEVFEALATQLLPRLLARKGVDSVIRVWVAGCSTGEEAYSIAILLREKLDALDSQLRVQVFATDIDPRAIAVARAGVYSANVAADIDTERLARCFTQQEDGSYRIQKSIRDLLVFSEQDVIKDPPFSNLDLISCRNLMIYMGPELQQKLIPLFHYALCPGGALLLGTSETVGEFGQLFSTSDRKAKLYQRVDDVQGMARPFLGKPPLPSEAGDVRRSKKKDAEEGQLSPREVTERALSEDTPVAALVNERGDLLYLHGHTGQYLEPAPGAIGVNILKMAREGLRHELTAALHRAVTKKERVSRPQLRVKTNGDFTLVDVTVRPAAADPRALQGPRLFLVTFEPAQALAALVEPKAAPSEPSVSSQRPAEERGRIAELERELHAKDEYLHATHEEMQSSNEELQSTNEELQSTNEELETSKEELQSLNEELATVNAELQNKVTDLSSVNNDMNNLLSATGIGTVFVDQKLRIRRFTPAVTQFINLIQTDVGRPLGHIVSNLVGYDRLVPDVQAVLETLTPGTVEVQTHAGASYLMRIKPYRTAENVADGAVVTFTEVTAIKDLQAALRESDTLRAQVGAVRDAQDAITVHDMEGRILAWNPGAVRMYGWSEAEALAMNIRSIIPPREREDALAVVQRLSRAEVLQPFRTQRVARGGRLVNVTLTATALLNAAGAVYAVSTTERGMGN